LVTLAGCGDIAKDGEAMDTSAAAAERDMGATEQPSAVVGPAWWRLDADLDLVDGLLSRERSQFTVAILDADGLILCEEDVRVASTDTVVARPEPELLTWWLVRFGEGTRTCAGIYDVSRLPTEIELGVGDLHPELQAVAGLVDGMPEAGASTLNAAYARVDGAVDDVWVYGFAGDDEAWLGVSGPATVAPLTDGAWTLRGIYSFPLPSEVR
jgi:hypothetical protein